MARDLLHGVDNLLPEPSVLAEKQGKMGYIKPFRLVLILGILLGHGVFAAESTARSEAAGAKWAAGWLSEIQRKYNPLPVALEGTDIDLIHPEKPRFTRPLLTGPLSIFLSAGANYPLPQGQTDFQFWLTRIANDQMRQRYAKIIQDLQQHFQKQGYSATRARLKAEDLFHEKNSIYYPLVHHGSPNLAGLKPNETRNPYGTQSLPNTAADNYNLGLLCQKVGNFEQAAQLYHLAATTGHAGAQASLAYLFEMGWGVAADASQATSYYSRAARQGHAVAQYNLGRIYQNGLPDPIQPIQPNLQLAEQYLRQAGAQGVVSAFHQLGVLYYQLGLSLTADSIPKETFEEWDTNDDNVISPQENRHLRDAHDHFLLAAQQGYGPALHAMGVIYQQGHGVPADPAQAVRWLEQAIAHPQPDSYYNLAQLYEHGRGTEPNLARAFMLYRQAARMSHAPSQYNVGLFYYQGRRAGTLLSISVPEEFARQHPRIIDDMVARNPRQNAILKRATAMYRTPNPNSPLRTLDLFIEDEHVQFAVATLRAMLPESTPQLEPVLAPLGGDDPVQASAWWTLAAEQKQPAAQQALALVNGVLTREQTHFAKAIAATEKARMKIPSPSLPVGQTDAGQLGFQPTDWGTGFFVSNDGFVIAGKHLLQSGSRFQVVTENGKFPAQVVNVPGDLDQYLLLKIRGDYEFPALSINTSHGARVRDPVQVLGYQMPPALHSTKPRQAKADTNIQGILGAQADPRFFTLRAPVLGDQLLLSFDHYLDDARSENKVFDTSNAEQVKLAKLQTQTIERLRGALRATHLLLGAADISIGYQLKTPLWYDSVTHEWLTEMDPQKRATKYPTGAWVSLADRVIKVAPDVAYVDGNKALLRLSAVPGVVPLEKTSKRLYELAETLLTQPAPGTRPVVQLGQGLEKIILDAKFTVFNTTPGFRGAALLNRQGQAIGLFFPGSRNRSPDVFQNFNSYHRYVLKSDHLLSYLNRASNVRYTTTPHTVAKHVSTGPSTVDTEAYRLAKAQASMVMVQVSAEQTAALKKGGQP